MMIPPVVLAQAITELKMDVPRHLVPMAALVSRCMNMIWQRVVRPLVAILYQIFCKLAELCHLIIMVQLCIPHARHVNFLSELLGCTDGYFLQNSMCVMCPGNSASTDPTSTSCICNGGTVTDGDSATATDDACSSMYACI